MQLYNNNSSVPYCFYGNSLDIQVLQYQSIIDQLNLQIQNLQYVHSQTCGDYTVQITKLQNVVNNQAKELNRLHVVRQEEIERGCESLRKKLIVKDNQLKELQKQTDEYKQNLEQASQIKNQSNEGDTAAKQMESLNELQQQLVEFKDNVKKMSNVISDLKQDNSTLQQQLNDCKNIVFKLKQDNDVLQTQLDDIQKEDHSRLDQMYNLKHQNDTLLNEKQQLQKQMMGMCRTTDLDVIKSENQNLKECVNVLKQETIVSKEKQEQMEKERSVHIKNIHKLKQRTKELKENLSDMEQKNKLERERVSKLVDSWTVADSARQLYVSKYKNLQSEYECLQKQYNEHMETDNVYQLIKDCNVPIDDTTIPPQFQQRIKCPQALSDSDLRHIVLQIVSLHSQGLQCVEQMAKAHVLDNEKSQHIIRVLNNRLMAPTNSCSSQEKLAEQTTKQQQEYVHPYETKEMDMDFQMSVKLVSCSCNCPKHVASNLLISSLQTQNKDLNCRLTHSYSSLHKLITSFIESTEKKYAKLLLLYHQYFNTTPSNDMENNNTQNQLKEFLNQFSISNAKEANK